jgi:hypothetical protein
VNWLEVAGVVLVVAGLLGGLIIAAQRPAFWVEFGTRLLARLWPFFFAYITKRMTPEKEQEWRDCIRRGGEWDHRRKRCKD